MKCKIILKEYIFSARGGDSDEKFDEIDYGFNFDLVFD
jgi:hypothetical protein